MKINSVLGPIDAADLGVTLMHEHIVNIEWNLARAFPGFYDRESVVKLFCEEMEALKAYGVRTFVDATPINLGRDVQLLRECAERSGVNIIGCTGIYWQEAPFFHQGVDVDVLAGLMLREVEHGMEGTDSKPGFIKCASQLETGESEINKNMLRAVAAVSKATGLPIYTHTNPGSEMGLYQQRIFAEEGVAPGKIAFGHVLPEQAEYAKKLSEKGSFFGCDQISHTLRHPRETGEREPIKGLREILDTDLRKQMFFSCDGASHSDFGRALLPDARDRAQNRLVLEGRRKRTLFDALLPWVREEYGDDVVREIMVDNPRRYFCGE